ncbi:MAG: hypothetical protein IAE94_06040 [Chthoniobacterales bacterium]|nr:hypothetical protein [Chthoniobacterales bacterium]
MSAQPNPSDSLPLGETDAGKPATGTKPAAKHSTKPTAKPELITKASPINPQWTQEALNVAGYPDVIAEALAPAVSKVIADEIQRKFSAAKIGRFAAKAFVSLRKK